MRDFIATFFLIVGAVSIISTYIYFRVPQPYVDDSSKVAAICSFGLAFLMLATAGALAFGG